MTIDEKQLIKPVFVLKRGKLLLCVKYRVPKCTLKFKSKIFFFKQPFPILLSRKRWIELLDKTNPHIPTVYHLLHPAQQDHCQLILLYTFFLCQLHSPLNPLRFITALLFVQLGHILL